MQSINQIKRMRQKFNLTQKDLAKKAGVSQSLIAKIEAEKLDPTYSKAQSIFQALEEIEKKQELTAKDIMIKNVLFIHVKEPVINIVKLMKKKGISQVPVLQRERVVGIITENTILNLLSENPESLQKAKAADIMEEAPPIISTSTRIQSILQLLKDEQVLLVSQKGEIKGLITKSDLFNIEY